MTELRTMGKSCCAVGCTNRYKKGSGIQFYRFPEDKARTSCWVAAVGRKNWSPSEYTWICSVLFVSGAKSNDPLSPDYVPSVFDHTKSPVKRRAVEDLERFRRNSEMKRRKLENSGRQSAAQSLLELSIVGNGTTYCEPHSGAHTMTDLTMSDMSELTVQHHELETLHEENANLKNRNQDLVEQCDSLKEECKKL